MTRIVTFAGIALAVLLLSPSPALACTCVDLRPFTTQDYRKWFDGLGAAFQGRVLSMERIEADSPFGPNGTTGPHWRVSFRVDRQWKGVTSSEITVYTALLGDSCGVRFVADRSYLVAAHQTASGLHALLCDEFYLEDELAFRKALGEGSLPKPMP
jgi:hypothetical protein